MKRIYQVAGGAIFGFALFVGWQAVGMRYYSSLGPGPGFFPLWLAGILGLLAVVMVCQATFAASEPMPDDFVPSRSGARRLGAVAVMLALVVALLEPLGFRLTMLLFFFALLAALGGQSMLVSALIAVGASLGSHFLFVELLRVPLPAGVLGL